MADTETNVLEGKLPVLRSPVVQMSSSSRATTFIVRNSADRPNIDDLGFRDAQDVVVSNEIPEFHRHDNATALEVFYDLFFAANLCVYSEFQDITNSSQLATFVCYFCLLWFTWAVLGLFDVRFITDSIFERMCRAVHFGAMVGFALVAPTFSLATQDPRTFRTMSIILMTSRLMLAVQYSSILWHVRKFRSARVPLGIMVAMNVVAGLVYLGVAFGFKDTGTRGLWAIWFVLTAVELAISVWSSLRWEVLSFQGTHLTNRMSLLTFILMGEGIVTVCSAVGKIVVNANEWTSPTIGNVTAGVANVYIIFMIYIDWRRAKQFPKYKQLIWSFLHLPFHLALKLFILASSQFVIWWKVFETLYNVRDDFDKALAKADEPGFFMETSWLVHQMDGVIQKVFETFTPKYIDTVYSIEGAMEVIKSVPDQYWNMEEGAVLSPVDQRLEEEVSTQLETLFAAITNSLLATFNINGYSAVTYNGNNTDLELSADEANYRKFHTVFIAAYSAAGFTVILLNILFITSRSRKQTVFNYVRKGINFVIGIGLCLVPLVTLNDEKSQVFTMTPWPLPTLVITLFFILVLNHLPHPPPMFFEGKAQPIAEHVPLQGWEGKDKRESAAVSLVDHSNIEGEDRKSGYHNISVHDQDIVETAYLGAGGVAAEGQRYGS